MIRADQWDICGPVAIHADDCLSVSSVKAWDWIDACDEPVHHILFQHFHKFNLTVYNVDGIADDTFVIVPGQLVFDTAHYPGKKRMFQAGDHDAHEAGFPACLCFYSRGGLIVQFFHAFVYFFLRFFCHIAAVV